MRYKVAEGRGKDSLTFLENLFFSKYVSHIEFSPELDNIPPSHPPQWPWRGRLVFGKFVSVTVGRTLLLVINLVNCGDG